MSSIILNSNKIITRNKNSKKFQVVFFQQKNFGFEYYNEISGEEFGSYFGASLLVIHNNSNGDDILVGAPSYSGTSFDEGCVYYYKNNNVSNFTEDYWSPI